MHSRGHGVRRPLPASTTDPVGVAVMSDRYVSKTPSSVPPRVSQLAPSHIEPRKAAEGKRKEAAWLLADRANVLHRFLSVALYPTNKRNISPGGGLRDLEFDVLLVVANRKTGSHRWYILMLASPLTPVSPVKFAGHFLRLPREAFSGEPSTTQSM